MKNCNLSVFQIAFLGILIVAIAYTNMMQAQVPLPIAQMNMGVTESSPFFNDNGTLRIVQHGMTIHSGKLGIGITSPLGKLHISDKSGLLLTEPIFRIDLKTPIGEGIASIENFIFKEGQTYGIYQSSVQGGVLNHFQDPVEFNTVKIFGERLSSGLNCNLGVLDFTFRMQKILGGPLMPILSIHPDDITVTGKTITNDFQLLTSAGDGRVLVSDVFGNGTWTNASVFNDNDWIETGSMVGDGTGLPPINDQKSLHLNSIYRNVGIGTANPVSKLHVVDGNILLSRSRLKAPGSLNGSILFGEVIAEENPLGEWGIEYFTAEEGYAAGGLNFWKVFSANNSGENFCLYLKNTGTVGIGTSNPVDKFQVNEGVGKLSLGTATLEVLAAGSSYMGFNAARYRSKESNYWLFESNGNSNGGNVTYGDVDGNYHIISVPGSEAGAEPQKYDDVELAEYIRMTVTKNGDVGIGTTNTHGYRLAVNGKILCTNLKVQLEGDWPDFVFNKGYKLPSIKEVENYISEHKHLPGIPSAPEIAKNGVDVGEMNAGLLKKVEELTLYIIDQQKQLEKQQQQIDALLQSLKTR